MNERQENIKYLISRPNTPEIKPPMHRSIFTESVKRSMKSNKGCHQTMGYAQVPLDPPSRFLKKHTRKVVRRFVGKSRISVIPIYYSVHMSPQMVRFKHTQMVLKTHVSHFGSFSA